MHNFIVISLIVSEITFAQKWVAKNTKSTINRFRKLDIWLDKRKKNKSLIYRKCLNDLRTILTKKHKKFIWKLKNKKAKFTFASDDDHRGPMTIVYLSCILQIEHLIFMKTQISVGNRFRRTFPFKMLFRRRWKIKVTSFVKRCMCIDFVICYHPLYLYNHSWDSFF